MGSLNKEQLSLIREGFELGFTEEEISLYANTSFSTSKMRFLIDILKKGYSYDTAKRLSKINIRKEDYTKIETMLKNGITARQIELFAKTSQN